MEVAHTRAKTVREGIVCRVRGGGMTVLHDTKTNHSLSAECPLHMEECQERGNREMQTAQAPRSIGCLPKIGNQSHCHVL